MPTPELPNEHLIPATIETFWTTIPNVWGRIKGNVRSIATDKDISVGQFHVLRHIRKGRTSVSDLALVTRLSRSAMSQAVDGLVERGFICRKQNAQDRRNIPLELTDSGNTLLDAISEQNRNWMKSQMRALTVQELKTINRAMAILGRTFAASVD